MRRREFIAATAALLASPRRSWAQGTRRRLGFLAIGDASGQALNQAELALLDGLRNHGWIDGKNLIMEDLADLMMKDYMRLQVAFADINF